MRTNWWQDRSLFDSLRISADEYAAIVARLAGPSDAVLRHEKRHGARLPYAREDVALRLHRHGGVSQHYRPRTVNISVRGMSVLHGFFVHAGVRCDVALPTMAGEYRVHGGVVIRCRHVQARVHELGIAFDRQIELRDFVPGDAAADGRQGPGGGEDAARFCGSVLVVDRDLEDRAYLEFVAGELGLTCATAASAQAALEAIEQKPCDAVITNLELPDDATGGWIQKLRERGFTGFVAAVAYHAAAPGEGAADVQAQAMKHGCDAVLLPPITATRLAELLRGVLPQVFDEDDRLEPLTSTHWANLKMRPLITTYLAQLEQRVQQLGALLAAQNREQFAQVCRQAGGSAQNFGYPAIAEKLAQLGALGVDGARIDELRAELAELTLLCARARRILE